MGKLVNIITPLHKKTTRDYLGRMMNEKVACMKVAKQFGFEFWDGDRKYGYGGYKYDGRWKSVAKTLIETYKLGKNAKILDVGCGKAHLLYELKKLLPSADVVGFDISSYAIEHAIDDVKPNVFVHRAQDAYPWGDKHFDLVLSLNTLHNLQVFELSQSLSEIERVGKNKYIVVEGFRNEEELFNLECWALTAMAFFTPEAWIWMYRHFGYTGDYEFIYFE